MIRAFQQAHEYIVSLVYAHLFVHQIAMHLHLHLELNLIVKVTGLSGLFPPSKLPAATGWTRMLHIPYLSHPENFCLIDCGIPRATSLLLSVWGETIMLCLGHRLKHVNPLKMT